MITLGLVGRDRELGILTNLIGQVRQQGGAVVVTREPGIGKTSLRGAAAEYRRHAGLKVLMTTGIEPERSCRSPGGTSYCGLCPRPPAGCRAPSARPCLRRSVRPTRLSRSPS